VEQHVVKKSHLRNVNIPAASWKLYFILFFVLAEIKTFELILSLILYKLKMSSILNFDGINSKNVNFEFCHYFFRRAMYYGYKYLKYLNSIKYLYNK